MTSSGPPIPRDIAVHESSGHAGRRCVLLKGINGLGNRILALLSALLYARLAGRQLMVDWSDGMYAATGVNAFPLLFRSRTAIAVHEGIAGTSVTPWLWSGHWGRSAVGMIDDHGLRCLKNCPFAGLVFSGEVSVLDHPEEVVVLWSRISFVGSLRRHFTGAWTPWRTLSETAILSRLLREEIELHPSIVERAAAIRDEWPDAPRIGVHVRHTDRRTSISRIQRRLDGVLARRPESRVFLATDDKAVQEAFRRKYPGLLTVPKWFPSSGPLHGRHSGCPDRLSMARESLVEMHLLAGCDDLVVDCDSSYSQVARLLWHGDEQRVVDVRALGWLSDGVRETVWRTRDWLRWGPLLFRVGMPLRPPRAHRAGTRRNPS